MHIKLSPSQTLVAAALTLTGLSSHAVTLVGITSQNQVAVIDTANIGASTPVNITGLMAGERFVSIDLRPTTNSIYGVTTQSRLYTLDQVTGAASFVANIAGSPIASGVGYGIDFNPLADFNGATSLRVINSAGQNLAVNANSGAVGFTGTTGTFTGLSAAAYNNTVPKATTAPAAPTLFYINSATDTLHSAVGNFNVPTINLIGSLGVDVLNANGFDIVGGLGYAALTVDAGTSLVTDLYSINLSTGAATSLGTFNGTLSGLTAAVVPEPETYALMLAGLAAVGFMAKRRKSV